MKSRERESFWFRQRERIHMQSEVIEKLKSPPYLSNPIYNKANPIERERERDGVLIPYKKRDDR